MSIREGGDTQQRVGAPIQIVDRGGTNGHAKHYGMFIGNTSAPPPTIRLHRTEAPKMPSVDAATIGKVASGLVFLVCALSLVVWWTTGFAMIFPPMAMLIIGISALFFVISALLDRQWKK